MTSQLLSRMAETLFWTGRYVERADDTARLVDVYVHRLLGDPGVQRVGSGADCSPLFGILGVEPGPDAEPDVGVALFWPTTPRARAPSSARCSRPGPAPAASAR